MGHLVSGNQMTTLTISGDQSGKMRGSECTILGSKKTVFVCFSTKASAYKTWDHLKWRQCKLGCWHPCYLKCTWKSTPLFSSFQKYLTHIFGTYFGMPVDSFLAPHALIKVVRTDLTKSRYWCQLTDFTIGLLCVMRALVFINYYCLGFASFNPL